MNLPNLSSARRTPCPFSAITNQSYMHSFPEQVPQPDHILYFIYMYLPAKARMTSPAVTGRNMPRFPLLLAPR